MARTVIQLLDTSDALPCLTIDDAPAMPWRGVMVDTSRGKVSTLTTLQTVVVIIASFKLNMLQLYMESTFAFRSNPRISADWGMMTPAEVVALDAYCRDRYVDLVLCLQSLGHHRRLLLLPEYAHLAYLSEQWTLTLGEETWRLLEELYDDLLPYFTSPYINVCGDESYDLTHTTALTHEAAIGYVAGSETTTSPVADAARGRGRTMMLWDDIFQQAPDMLAEVPPDTIFLSWF